jgi:flagellar secretion chaperone FliS
MAGFGAQAYKRVSVDTGVAGGDPHDLVLMLYDGAISAARQALGHMQAGRIAEKAAALSKATRIVDEGLKISLDKTAGGQLAQRLSDLYEYMTMRLLQANLRNDVSGLTEVLALLEDLRGAWAQIRKPAAGSAADAARAAASAPQAMPATSPAAAIASGAPLPSAPAVPAAFAAPEPAPAARSRFFDGAGAAPSRSFAASA